MDEQKRSTKPKGQREKSKTTTKKKENTKCQEKQSIRKLRQQRKESSAIRSDGVSRLHLSLHQLSSQGPRFLIWGIRSQLFLRRSSLVWQPERPSFGSCDQQHLD